MPDAPVVIVSGAAAGIGRAAVEAVLDGDETARVAGLDLAALPDDLTSRYGKRLVGLQVDVSDHDAVERTVAEAERLLGTPTGLVCSAGIQLYGDAATMPRADFDKVLSINQQPRVIPTEEIEHLKQRQVGSEVRWAYYAELAGVSRD